MRVDELSAGLAPALREQVDALCAATNAARGVAGLAQLESESALAEVAQRAGSWEIRLAAAQRISDPDLLARIVEATRHRDNRVYQHCSDLLRARRRSLGHAMRAAELAAAFRGILATQSDREALPADRFDELDTELNSLRQEFNVPQECLELAAAVRERVQRDVEAMRDLGSDAAEADALCARIESAARPADAEVLRTKFHEIVERSSRRVAWLAGHPTAAALSHSIDRAQAALDALAVVPEVAAPMHSTPASGETNALSAPSAPPALRAVRAKVAGGREAVRELLDRLALQLEAGQLAEAEETERQMIAIAAGGPLPESLMRRLRRERAQLGRMRDWARWGDDQARAQLIRAAAELLQGDREPEALATAVTGMREEWRRLDASRHATRKQWERFDAVLTKAFRPVLEFRAKRASEAKAGAAAKASFCDECEAWAAGIDWQRAEFRSIAAQRHELRTRWRALPFAGFREERRLRKRFDKQIKAVEERLGAARQAERSRREALIGEAEALREAPQLGDAIKAVVALQAKWKDSGLSVDFARHDEQALWQRFRRACDAVFARRDAQRAARDAERDRHLDERKKLLAEFESALAGNDAGAVARAQAEFKRAWGGAQRNARDKSDPLEGRARDLVRKAERGIAALRSGAARGRFERLALDSALAAAQASAAILDKGRAEREALLLDLELALDLPSPASAAGARRARQLSKLQERFRPGNTDTADAETLALRWYATAARSDPEHESRMSAIVEALLKVKLR
jgi:hypothetical protein